MQAPRHGAGVDCMALWPHARTFETPCGAQLLRPRDWAGPAGPPPWLHAQRACRHFEPSEPLWVQLLQKPRAPVHGIAVALLQAARAIVLELRAPARARARGREDRRHFIKKVYDHSGIFAS